MAISTRDLEIVNTLCGVEKSILDEYEKVRVNDFSQANILAFLNIEDDLLDSLDLTAEKVEELENYVREKTGAPLTSILPCGINVSMNKSTYPYIRLFARIRYRYKSQSGDLNSICETVLLDSEIALFYKSLMNDSVFNPSIRDGLRNYALMCLVDSPRVERQIVQNGLRPLKYVDDCFDFCFELWKIHRLKRLDGSVSIPYEGVLLRKRQERLDKLFEEMTELAGGYTELRNSKTPYDLELVMCASYFKAIVALQPADRREDMHNNFVKGNQAKLKSSSYKEYIDVSKANVEDALVPSVRRISFVPRKKKQ